MFNDSISYILKTLPIEQKRSLADAYRRLAEDLDEQINRAVDHAAYLKNFDVRLDVRHGIPAAMKIERELIANDNDAAAVVAHKLGTTVETVLHHWRGYIRDQLRQARLERDRAILKMARAGKKNAEIARHFNLSRPYVSKIVTRNFRRFARYGDR